MKKTIMFITILTLLAVFFVSCGSDPTVPSGNNNNGSNNNSNTNTNTEKTICYIYQYDLTAPTGGSAVGDVNAAKTQYRNVALKTSFKNYNGEDKEYLLSFGEGFKLYERNPESNTYYAFAGVYNNSSRILIERRMSDGDMYFEYGSNPSEAEQYLQYTYRSFPECPAHWGVKVKIGETETRIFYAIAPIYAFNDFNSSFLDFSDNLHPIDASPKFYAFCNNYESATYIETVNGIEFYNSNIQKGDEVCFRAIDKDIIYFNPELNKSFTFDEMTSHILNSGLREQEYQDLHFRKDTILERNTWICEGFFDWSYALTQE